MAVLVHRRRNNEEHIMSTYTIQFIANGELQVMKQLAPEQIQAITKVIESMEEDTPRTTYEMPGFSDKEIEESLSKLTIRKGQ